MRCRWFFYGTTVYIELSRGLIDHVSQRKYRTYETVRHLPVVYERLVLLHPRFGPGRGSRDSGRRSMELET